MDLKFAKSTDAVHEVSLDSFLLYAIWRSGIARCGATAHYEIGTSFVGYGAPMEIHGKTESGTILGVVNTVVTSNKVVGEFPIPADLQLGEKVYFEARLPEHNLTRESNRIFAFPPIEVTNLRWSTDKVTRGDTVTLKADIKNAFEGEETKIRVYLYDDAGVHQRIAELPTTVAHDSVELLWEHDYRSDTYDIPTESELNPNERHYNPVRYFFTVFIEDQEFGKEQESGLLAFRDWIEVKLLNCTEKNRYKLHLPDGTTREGRFDEQGVLREEDVPPGKYSVEITSDGA